MFCGNCGAKLDDGAAFCGQCGQRVEGAARASGGAPNSGTPPSQADGVPTPPPPEPPAYTPSSEVYPAPGGPDYGPPRSPSPSGGTSPALIIIGVVAAIGLLLAAGAFLVLSGALAGLTGGKLVPTPASTAIAAASVQPSPTSAPASPTAVPPTATKVPVSPTAAPPSPTAAQPAAPPASPTAVPQPTAPPILTVTQEAIGVRITPPEGWAKQENIQGKHDGTLSFEAPGGQQQYQFKPQGYLAITTWPTSGVVPAEDLLLGFEDSIIPEYVARFGSVDLEEGPLDYFSGRLGSGARGYVTLRGSKASFKYVWWGMNRPNRVVTVQCGSSLENWERVKPACEKAFSTLEFLN